MLAGTGLSARPPLPVISGCAALPNWVATVLLGQLVSPFAGFGTTNMSALTWSIPWKPFAPRMTWLLSWPSLGKSGKTWPVLSPNLHHPVSPSGSGLPVFDHPNIR